MIGIVMPVFNRPEYLERTLKSLSDTILKDCIICLIDDGSDNQRTKELVQQFNIEGICIIKIYKKHNVGMFDSMCKGFNKLIDYGCDILINVDSDVIFKKDWLTKMLDLYYKFPSSMITGFMLRNKENLTTNDKPYYKIATCGGVSQLYSKYFYKRYIEKYLVNNLWDIEAGKNIVANKISCYATKPSVIQHIGQHGKNSNPNIYDYAEDF